jgi:hypothetical protein
LKLSAIRRCFDAGHSCKLLKSQACSHVGIRAVRTKLNRSLPLDNSQYIFSPIPSLQRVYIFTLSRKYAIVLGPAVPPWCASGKLAFEYTCSSREKTCFAGSMDQALACSQRRNSPCQNRIEPTEPRAFRSVSRRYI